MQVCVTFLLPPGIKGSNVFYLKLLCNPFHATGLKKYIDSANMHVTQSRYIFSNKEHFFARVFFILAEDLTNIFEQHDNA